MSGGRSSHADAERLFSLAQKGPLGTTLKGPRSRRDAAQNRHARAGAMAGEDRGHPHRGWHSGRDCRDHDRRDRLQEAPLSEGGGKGLFVKRSSRRDIDLAVHSAKDMSAVLPGELIAAVLPRRIHVTRWCCHKGPLRSISSALVRRDVSNRNRQHPANRPAGAALPHARFTPIRGNVDARLRLTRATTKRWCSRQRACAGSRVTHLAAIPIDVLPAPGQGIVAVEIRGDDRVIRNAVSPIGDRDAANSLAAERAVVAALGGGCQLPLGAIAEHCSEGLTIKGVVAWPDGRLAIRRTFTGSASDPATVGARLADELLRAGAAEILNAVRSGVTS